MNRLVSALAALSFCTLALATPRPQLLLPAQEIRLPAGLEVWGVGVSGDWLAVGGAVYFSDPSVNARTERVYLYRRGSNGTWDDGTLLFEKVSDQYAANLEMNEQILVIGSGLDTHVFEKTPTGWAARTLDFEVASSFYPSVTLDGTAVMLGDGHCGATGTVLERTSATHWSKTGQFHGQPKTCDANQFNPLWVALSGNTAVLWDARSDRPHERARVFDRNPDSTWTNSGFLAPPNVIEYMFGTSLAMRGPLALVGGWDRGAYVYRRSQSGGWSHTGYLTSLEHASQFSSGLRIEDPYIGFLNYNSTVDSQVLHVVRETATEGFDEVAQLTTPHREILQPLFDFSGSEVVAATLGKVFFYQLPASPGTRRPLQYDFESGAAAEWTVVPGGAFSVAQSGPSRVYRQASTAGDAGAILAEDLATQAIEAEITPRAFDGTDRWFGLVTRYTDESNYYYVTVRNRGAGVASLRRMRNGTFTELAAANVAVSLDKPLRVRLESTVDRHVVFVDDRPVVSAVDDTLTHGRAGVRTYRAAADFDNVLVSASPPALYVSEGFSAPLATFDAVDGQWGLALAPGSYAGPYVQQSTSGDARSVAWLDSDDQVVQTRVRVDQFDGGNGDPWVGLVARYQDASNYYYVTLRRSNQVSLRKLVGGQITVLASAPVPANGSAGQALRLEVVGEKLRVHVDGKFMFETTDATFASGKSGLVTYRAAATFLDFSAWRP